MIIELEYADVVGVTMIKYLNIQTCFYSINFGKEIPYVGTVLGTKKMRQRIEK